MCACRAAIFRVHLRQTPVFPDDVDVSRLALLTAGGYTGADIMAVCR